MYILPKYLIWSNEHNSWWRENSGGYTDDVENAGRYCFTEALEICNNANYGWNTDRLRALPNELPIAEEVATALIYKKYKTNTKKS